jgi:glutamyl/glutaminyl-tRNA synthetase
MSMEEMATLFRIEDINTASPVFDKEKLRWMNREYLKKLSPEELKTRLTDYAVTHLPENHPAITEEIVSMAHERAHTLRDALSELQWFEDPEYSAELLIWKETPRAIVENNLKTVYERLKEAPEEKFTQEAVEKLVMPLTDERGRGEVLWPLRVALSGKDRSPSPFELMALLGKEKSLARIQTALKKLGIP